MISRPVYESKENAKKIKTRNKIVGEKKRRMNG